MRQYLEAAYRLRSVVRLPPGSKAALEAAAADEDEPSGRGGTKRTCRGSPAVRRKHQQQQPTPSTSTPTDSSSAAETPTSGEPVPLTAAEREAAAEARAAVVSEAVALVRRWRFSHEHVGDGGLLRRPELWRAFIEAGLPMTALTRNLGRMASLGVFDAPDAVRRVCAQLRSERAVRAARLHPISLLEALRVYESGRGERGKLRWRPDTEVAAALEDAFYLSFKNVEPTGKRFLVAMDVSGSMGGAKVCGMPSLTAREAAAAMSMALLRSETNVTTVGFSHGITELGFTREQTLGRVCDKVSNLPFDATDCSAPMLYALDRGLPIDVFVVLTDNETYFGDVHPTEALRQYRTATGIDARLVVMAFSATDFSIANPEDPRMLDIGGLDSAVPRIIHEFVQGKL